MHIRVHVTPGAKKETIVQTSSKEGRPEYTVTVREEAERNLANTRVRELIARTYRVPVGKVRIVSGHRSPTKVISFT